MGALCGFTTRNSPDHTKNDPASKMADNQAQKYLVKQPV